MPQPFLSLFPNFIFDVVHYYPLGNLCICYPLLPSNFLNFQDSSEAASFKFPEVFSHLAFVFHVSRPWRSKESILPWREVRILSFSSSYSPRLSCLHSLLSHVQIFMFPCHNAELFSIVFLGLSLRLFPFNLLQPCPKNVDCLLKIQVASFLCKLRSLSWGEQCSSGDHQNPYSNKQVENRWVTY